MECPRRRNITYKETGEIWFMTVRVMRFLPGMSRYFSSYNGIHTCTCTCNLHYSMTYVMYMYIHVFDHFFLTSPPSFLSYRRWDSSLRRFSSLGRKRGRQPFFLLSGVPQLQCGCAHSRSLIFSQPAHAVRRRRMWSIRSTIVGERRCRLVREGKNDRYVRWASRTSTSAIPTSTTSRTSVAAAVARLKKMSSSHARFSC